MFNRILTEIESATKLWGKLKSFFGKESQKKTDSVVARFIRLCENYGIHRNQIPRFIGHGLTLADVKEDDTLLLKLTEDILGDVCDRFAVRREWLDGAETQIYPEHDFYKSPYECLEFLTN